MPLIEAGILIESALEASSVDGHVDIDSFASAPMGAQHWRSAVGSAPLTFGLRRFSREAAATFPTVPRPSFTQNVAPVAEIKAEPVTRTHGGGSKRYRKGIPRGIDSDSSAQRE